MKTLARRNAEVAKRTEVRKALLVRKRAKEQAHRVKIAPSGGVASGAIVRACGCGKLLKGNAAVASHRRACPLLLHEERNDAD